MIIVNLFYIYHILSYSPYSVIQSYFHHRLGDMILLISIHEVNKNLILKAQHIQQTLQLYEH